MNTQKLPSISSLIGSGPLNPEDSGNLYCTTHDLMKALGITQDEAISRIKSGAIYAGAPLEVAAEYFASLVGCRTEELTPLLRYIDLRAFTKDSLKSGKLVRAVLAGKSYTIEPSRT